MLDGEWLLEETKMNIDPKAIIKQAMESQAPSAKPWYITEAMDFDAEWGPPPEPVVTINGLPLARPKDIVGIVGRQKSGKTTAYDDMAVEMVSPGRSRIGFRLGENVSISIFDGEQSDYDVRDQVNRIFLTAGKPRRSVPGLLVYSWAHLGPDELKENIFRAVRESRPDIAVIDNLLCLTHDFNNPAEAQSLFRGLRDLARETETAFFLVVHTNAGATDKRSKAMGNIGSTLHRFCSMIMRTSKDPSTGVFTIEPDDDRRGSFAPVQYQKDKCGIIPESVVVGELESPSTPKQKPQTVEDKILAVMEPGKEYTADGIYHLLDGKVKQSSIRPTLTNLCSAGRLTKPSRGKYALTDLTGMLL